MKRIVKEPEIRRLEIIMSAKMLFEAHGYENTSVESIIKEAGIAKGTFYYYFKTKKDILTALVNHIGSDLKDHFESIVALKNVKAVEKLKRMIRGEEKKHKTSPTVMALIHKPENRELQEQLNIQSVQNIAPLIAQVIEQGNKEGVFNAKTPIESVQLLLAASQFVLDSGLFNWPENKRVKLLKALQASFEQSIGAKSGSLGFIANEK
ncbi:MAG: TetR/AcrR family transcriptional regulator [Candidatus Berkiella sp.]